MVYICFFLKSAIGRFPSNQPVWIFRECLIFFGGSSLWISSPTSGGESCLIGMSWVSKCLNSVFTQQKLETANITGQFVLCNFFWHKFSRISSVYTYMGTALPNRLYHQWNTPPTYTWSYMEIPSIEMEIWLLPVKLTCPLENQWLEDVVPIEIVRF